MRPRRPHSKVTQFHAGAGLLLGQARRTSRPLSSPNSPRAIASGAGRATRNRRPHCLDWQDLGPAQLDTAAHARIAEPEEKALTRGLYLVLAFLGMRDGRKAAAHHQRVGITENREHQRDRLRVPLASPCRPPGTFGVPGHSERRRNTGRAPPIGLMAQHRHP